MKSSLFLLIALGASLFLVTFSAAQNVQCLGYSGWKSLIKPGEGCGGAVPCQRGYHCGDLGVCVELKSAGDSCKRHAECPYGSQCVGTNENNKKCRVNANPGEACKNDGSGPVCATATCSVDDKCPGGNHGDACKTDVDCDSGNCSSGLCKSPYVIGDNCTSTCGFNQYCNSNGKCAAGKTSGSCTDDQCAKGHHCIPKTFKADADRECVKRRSRVGGEWCYNNGYVCAQGICHRGRCIDKSPDICGSCVIGEVCTCEDSLLASGTGVCKEDKCHPLIEAFYDCTSQKCETPSRSYTKSCANLSCNAEWEAYVDCDPQLILSMWFDD